MLCAGGRPRATGMRPGFMLCAGDSSCPAPQTLASYNMQGSHAIAALLTHRPAPNCVQKKIKYEELEEESDDDEPLAKRVKPAPVRMQERTRACVCVYVCTLVCLCARSGAGWSPQPHLRGPTCYLQRSDSPASPHFAAPHPAPTSTAQSGQGKAAGLGLVQYRNSPIHARFLYLYYAVMLCITAFTDHVHDTGGKVSRFACQHHTTQGKLPASAMSDTPPRCDALCITAFVDHVRHEVALAGGPILPLLSSPHHTGKSIGQGCSGIQAGCQAGHCVYGWRDELRL